MRPRSDALPHKADPGSRWLVRIIMLFYVALLVEGVLRKWVAPGASNALVFLRDPLMLLILALYLRRGPTPEMRRPMAVLAVAGLILVLCAACQASTTAVPGLVLLVGMRNYVLFVPLCFAIRDAFTAEDYRRWIRLNLALAGPIAALVLLQYRSSPTAAVNAVPGGGSDGVFMLVDDVVRPYGVFSFALGHSAYAAWMAGVALAALVGARTLRLGVLLPAWGVAGIAVMGVLSGSRTYFVLAGSVLGCFVAATTVFGAPRVKLAGLAAVAGIALVATAALLFVPSLVDNLLERQSAAGAIEGALSARLLQVLTDFMGELSCAPLFGFGLGSGTNIANYLANGRTDHVLAEYELTRIIQELGPIFGLGYILTRWGFLAWVAVRALRAAARGNLHPACTLGFLVPVFLAHDITLQNTMIGIGWFSAGIALSAERVGPQTAALPAARRLAPAFGARA